VDCAILLCLAGGWPASVECAHAQTVFIARITPWPVEPPLQIWNCPMRAAALRNAPVEKLFDVAGPSPSSLPISLILEPLASLQTIADRADVDISDPTYDFVRSIHVYQTEFGQIHGHDDKCTRWSSVRLGTYGAQGEYAWSESATDKLPDASGFRQPVYCETYVYRSVLVDWRDFEGHYGFEEVRY
jgi:hypothetical protein